MKSFENEDAEIAAAIHALARKARGDFARGASARYWARRHPWIAALAGFTSGFVVGESAAAIMTPAGGRQLLRSDTPRSNSTSPAGRAAFAVSRLVHGSVKLLKAGVAAGAKASLRELASAAKRKDNWFPPG